MIKRIYFYISKIEEILLITCMFIIVATMTIGVFFRYVLSSPLPWPEEIGKLVLVWIVFIGASIGIRSKGHISINFLISKFSLNIQKIIESFILLTMLIILCAILYFGGIRTYLGFSSILPAIKIPYVFLFLPVPISCFTIIIHVSVHLSDLIRKKV